MYGAVWEYSTTSYLKGFSDAIVPSSGTAEAKVEAILAWMQHGPERRSTATPSSPMALRDPEDTLNYRGLLDVCGSATNAFVNLAQSSGLRSRRLLLLGPDSANEARRCRGPDGRSLGCRRPDLQIYFPRCPGTAFNPSATQESRGVSRGDSKPSRITPRITPTRTPCTCTSRAFPCLVTSTFAAYSTGSGRIGKKRSTGLISWSAIPLRFFF